LQPAEGLPEIDPRSFVLLTVAAGLWIRTTPQGCLSVTKETGPRKNPAFINYSTANGLLSDTALGGSREDDEGRVYVRHGKGLLSRFDAPPTTVGKVFTSKDGLAGDDIRSFYKDKQGNHLDRGQAAVNQVLIRRAETQVITTARRFYISRGQHPWGEGPGIAGKPGNRSGVAPMKLAGFTQQT